MAAYYQPENGLAFQRRIGLALSCFGSLTIPETNWPVDAVKYNIFDDAFQLGIIDAINGAAPPVRPPWCL